MANIRTLKLNLLGDVSQFRKSMKTAGQDTQSFSGTVKSQMKSLAKSAALAGVAVAGMAVAFGVDAVKAYAEDERGQRKLQVAIKNTTKATAKQRKGVEDFIAKTSLQYAVVDDKLRPAFQRLVQATKSLSKSQEILPVVLDAAAASGKDVETVAAALSKAYGGNAQSLARLGLGIDKAILKTGNFNAIMKELTKITGGQAKAAANSFDGKMAKFKISMDEAKESIGGAILKGLQPLAEKWLPKISQLVTDTIDGFMGKKGKRPGFSLGQSIRDVADAIGKLIASFNTANDGKQRTLAENITAIANALEKLASAIEMISRVNKKFQNFLNSPIGKVMQFMPGSAGIGLSRLAFNALTSGDNAPQTKEYNGQTYYYDDAKKKWYTYDAAGKQDYSVQPSSSRRRNFRQGSVDRSSFNGAPTIINLNGIVDAESARRSIQKVLNQSSIRTGPVAVNGSLI